MVGVALSGVVGIIFFAMQRVLADAGAEAALGAIEDGCSNAERSEVNACNDTHKNSCSGRPGRKKGPGARKKGPGAGGRGSGNLHCGLCGQNADSAEKTWERAYDRRENSPDDRDDLSPAPGPWPLASAYGDGRDLSPAPGPWPPAPFFRPLARDYWC